MATSLWIGKDPKSKFEQRDCEIVGASLTISKSGKVIASYPLARSWLTVPKYLSVTDRPHCFLLEVENLTSKEKKGKEPERISVYLDAGSEVQSSQWLRDIRKADPLRVFYVSLDLATARSDSRKTIPRPWRMCIKWLNTNALDEPNLYCVPGSRTDVERYIHRFDADEKDIEIPASEHPHTVSSLLVHCLSDDLWNGQREPFLALAQSFHAEEKSDSSAASSSSSESVSAALSEHQISSLNEMRSLVAAYPRFLRASMRLLIEHFRLVVAHSENNGMTAVKLAAAVFPRSGSSINLMILYTDQIFGPPTMVFGESLETAVQRGSKEGIPNPIWDTVTWLDNNALHEVGLYRIPGDDRKVGEYVNHYNDGEEVVFPLSELSETVASVLKSFLYNMPESLLQSNLKHSFMAIHGDKGFGGLREQFSQMASGKSAISSAVVESKPETVSDLSHELSDEQKTIATKALIDEMLPRSRTFLQFLMRHWGRVARNSQVNKMTPRNIALSLYPSWSKTFEFLVEHQELLFVS